MISDAIVWSSVGLTLLFVAAWAASPALRAWIERPKHRFVDAVQAYDRGERGGDAGREDETP